jgi:hypothetical protein
MSADVHAVERLRGAAINRALTSLDELVTPLVPQLNAAIPEYALMPPEAIVELTRSVERVAEIILNYLGGTPLGADDRSFLSSLGRQRERQGVPLPTLLDSFAISFTAGWQHLLRETFAVPADAGLQAAAVSLLSVRLSSLIPEVTAAVVAGYDPVGHEPVATEEIVDRIVSGEWHEDTAGFDLAGLPGFGPETPVSLVILAAPRHTKIDVAAAASALVAEVPSAAQGRVRPWPTRHVPVLVAGSEDSVDHLSALLGKIGEQHGTTAVVAEPTGRPDELARRYLGTRGDLGLLPAMGQPPFVVRPRDLKLYRILDGGTYGDRVDFYQLVFGRLLRRPVERQQLLFDILDALWSTGLPFSTLGDVVGLGRRTVWDRKNELEALTGLSFAVPAERFQLELAARLRQLAALSPADYDAQAWGPPPRPLRTR